MVKTYVIGGTVTAGSSVFELGVFPIPIVGADYDRNRYRVYLGNELS